MCPAIRESSKWLAKEVRVGAKSGLGKTGREVGGAASKRVKEYISLRLLCWLKKTMWLAHILQPTSRSLNWNSSPPLPKVVRKRWRFQGLLSVSNLSLSPVWFESEYGWIPFAKTVWLSWRINGLIWNSWFWKSAVPIRWTYSCYPNRLYTSSLSSSFSSPRLAFTAR